MMKQKKMLYGIIKMSQRRVKALSGCACVCACTQGNDSAQTTALSNYLSSGAYA